MTRINLLPWRETRRKERARQFISIAVGSVLLMGAIILLTHITISNKIDGQTARNDFLTKEIADLDRRIALIKNLETEKAMLLARMNVIQDLQTSRAEIVHLVDELVKTLPDGAYYTSVKLQGNALTLEGIAQSNARVSTLMNNLEASPWLENPVLDLIETNENAKVRVGRYVLRANQKQKATEPVTGEAAAQNPGTAGGHR